MGVDRAGGPYASRRPTLRLGVDTLRRAGTARDDREVFISVITVPRRPWVVPELARGGGVAFFLATIVASAANFAFHVVMSRLLGPGTYGALGSILGIATVVTLAATALQAAVTQAVAETTPAVGAPATTLRRPAAGTAAAAGALFVVVGAVSPVLSGYLHLSSPLPVVLFGGFVAATLAAFVPQGVLMGRLRFSVVASALVAGALVRLAAGPLFYALGWGLAGAVAATLLNAVVVLGVLWWPLRHSLAAPWSRGLQLRLAPATLAVASLGGLSAFIGLDSFLARHYLAADASGYYVAAATAARIALFLPAAIGMLAFPRMAAAGGRGAVARTVLRHATLAVAAVGGAATLGIELAPRFLVVVLFGARYAPAEPALRVLALSAFGTGLVTVWVYALLARRSKLALLPWGAVGAVGGAVAVVHGSTTAVAWVVLVVGAALVAASAAAVWPSSTRHGRDGRDGGKPATPDRPHQSGAPRLDS